MTNAEADEMVARALCQIDGGNPDMFVYGGGMPYIVLGGRGFARPHEEAQPLWVFYVGAARTAINLVLSHADELTGYEL